jgi:hypothetical protein
MNKDKILNLPAGREMDELIAIHVFGYNKLPPPAMPSLQKPTSEGVEMLHFLGHYSTDIRAAWDVVEKIREAQTEIRIRGMEWYDGGGWVVEIMDILSKKVQYKSYVEVTGPERGIPNVCLAICRAALLTILDKRGETAL